MTIKVKRNVDGNCIVFEGSKNPTFFNTCLSTEANATEANNINVINDIKTGAGSAKEYEFFNIPFTEFRDSANASFATAAAARAYINEQANVTGSTGKTLLSATDTLDFSLNNSGTSILLDNGDSFGVNSITAVANSDNHIDIKTHANNIILFKNLRLARASIDGTTVTQTLATAVTELNNLFAGVSIVHTTNDFFHYDDNSQLTGREFNSAKGPAYWGQSLKAGEEMFFPNNVSGVLLVGKFGGATSVVGQTAAATSNWDRRIALDGQSDVSADGNQRYSSTAFQIGREMDGSGSNNFAMRYDSTTNKLQFIDFSHNHEMLIGQATSAEDGNPITMFFQAMSDADTFTGNVTLPAITHRKVDLILHAEHTAGDVTDDNYTNGVVEDAVFSMNKPLSKGEKLKFTPQTNHGAQAILFDYTGSSGSGTGQTGVESRTNSGLIFAAHDDSNAGNVTSSTGFTINQYSSRYDASSRTSNQVGREMSIRYHTDNKIDLYDEAAEEIIFTKDSNADGNPITLFLAGLADDSGSDKVLHLKGLNMEPVGTDMSARCASNAFTLGTSSNIGINSDPNQTKNRFYSDTDNRSSGVDKLNDQHDRVEFGAKLRPGMESSFTGPPSFLVTSTDKPRGNQVGVSTGSSVSGSDWSTRYAFQNGGALISTELIGASITSSSLAANTANDDMRLRYEHGTNLLHLDMIDSGVRKRVATGSVSLGGSEVLITNGGDEAKILGLGTPYFYGMEYAHTATAKPQEYRGLNNHFLDWPSQNTQIEEDTVLRHIDGILPGYKIKWQIPTETGNSIDFFFGDWKTSNASTGVSNPHSDKDKWNFGFEFQHVNEKIITSNLHNMVFNKKHPYYNDGAPNAVGSSATYWQRPNNQNAKTNVSWRYHSDNTLDLFDEDLNQVILNYTGTLDGSAFKFAWSLDAALTNSNHPGYITDDDPVVAAITTADGDLPNGTINNLLRGKDYASNNKSWYVAYGSAHGTRKPTPYSDRTVHPVYWGEALKHRHEMTFNFPAAGQTNNSNFALQIWKGAEDANTGISSMDIANVETAFGIHNVGLELDTTHGTDLSGDVALTDGEELVLRFSNDGKLRLLRPSTGYGILATSNTSFSGNNCLYIHSSCDANASDGNTTAPTLTQRGDFWKLVGYDSSNADSGYDEDDWRDNSVSSDVFYQTVRPLKLGQKYTGISLPVDGVNHMYGIGFGGYTGDTSFTSSLSQFMQNIGTGGDGTTFRWHTNESFNNSENLDYNTSNSLYNSSDARWDPGAGGALSAVIDIEFRYITSSKKVEIWDATNNEKIGTSTNVMEANGGDIHLVIGSIQNDLDATLMRYNIENN